MRKLLAALAADPWDVLALIGLLLFTAGLGWAWRPLWLIVPGVALLLLGVWGAKLGAYRRRSSRVDDETPAAKDA